MKRLALFVLALLALAPPVEARSLDVVASFTVLADVVREVGGDNVRVTSLVGPNGDPHEYEPSPGDAKQLKAADLVFVSGFGLEGWMDRLITASGYDGRPVTVSAGITPLTMDEDGTRVADPHVWNSAANVVLWVRAIEQALSAAAPEDAAGFAANAARYTAELQALDSYARDRLGAVPAQRRRILTSHDAFSYFAAAYGVTFLSPVGVSTDAGASAGAVARLITQIKAEGVKVYFFENSNDPRLVAQIADATGARSGGELYVESLSAADGPAPTYARMFRYNTDQILAALGN